MKVDTETMEIKRQKMDYIMHFTNPLWVMCRLRKIVGKKCALWMVGGVYDRAWCRIFK